MDKNKMVELLKNRFYIEAKKQDRGGVYALTQRKLHTIPTGLKEVH